MWCWACLGFTPALVIHEDYVGDFRVCRRCERGRCSAAQVGALTLCRDGTEGALTTVAAGGLERCP